MAGGRLSGLRARLEALARPRGPEPLPVAFDRRRIYVLPTAFGAFFALLLAVMLLGALNYNNNPALLLALLLAHLLEVAVTAKISLVVPLVVLQSVALVLTFLIKLANLF